MGPVHQTCSRPQRSTLVLAAKRAQRHRSSTVEALFVIEGQHDGAAADITPALGDLTPLLASYQPDSKLDPTSCPRGTPRS